MKNSRVALLKKTDIRGGERKDSYEISVIRFISMIMIIMCHLMQALTIELAWWFNVGVQIFLCISGFLYGHKNIDDLSMFYHRRFIRIYIPFLIAYIPFGVSQLVFVEKRLSIISFFKGILLLDTIPGGGHLWFVPTILICYAITPILQAYRDKFFFNRNQMIFTTFGLVVAETIYFGLFNKFFSPAWICCYTIGYVLGANDCKENLLKDHIIIIFILFLTIILNGIQIYYDYIKHSEFLGYSYFVQYAHVSLGIFIFLFMRKCIKRHKKKNFDHIIRLSDTYSYEIYLIHGMLILGPYSLISLTPILAVNVVLIIGCTFILSYIAKQINVFLNAKMNELSYRWYSKNKNFSYRG